MRWLICSEPPGIREAVLKINDQPALVCVADGRRLRHLPQKNRLNAALYFLKSNKWYRQSFGIVIKSRACR
jgi:hypothetical protein